MPDKAVFDTRFFIEYFYSGDEGFLKKLTETIVQTKNRIISSVTIYEVYKLILVREGREIARHRVEVMKRDFQITDLNQEIAVNAAEINHGTGHPMADSVIAATAKMQNASVITDDPHFNEVKSLKVHWPKK
ncbi:MAG: PIN domain-containing protein [Candidatus Bathyarchaeota archaeon]